MSVAAMLLALLGAALHATCTLVDGVGARLAGAALIAAGAAALRLA